MGLGLFWLHKHVGIHFSSRIAALDVNGVLLLASRRPDHRWLEACEPEPQKVAVEASGISDMASADCKKR